jgi:hypothetical protein
VSHCCLAPPTFWTTGSFFIFKPLLQTGVPDYPYHVVVSPLCLYFSSTAFIQFAMSWFVNFIFIYLFFYYSYVHTRLGSFLPPALIC